MRIPRWLPGLLILGTGVGGCSQTGSFRQPESGEVRTTASVGDRPISIATGIADDGGSARAEERASYNPRTSEGRISGRVYDEHNEPVPNARVRLAVGGEPGGKAIFATTDRSGAFTLRGLRPGSNYTLIAEYQGEQGMMSGRADADAPDTGVRIALHPRDAGTGGDGRVLASRPNQSKLRAISRAEELDDEAWDDEAWDDEEPPARDARPRHNREDLAPPTLDDFNDDFDDFRDEEPPRARSSRRPAAPSRYSDEFQDDWDDGENPLPPARELGDVGDRGWDRGPQTRVARAGDDIEVEVDELPPAAEFESESDSRSRARTLRPEAFAPIMIDDPEPHPSRFEAAPPARDHSDEPSRREAPIPEPKRPTWGEVVSQRQEIPVDESLMQTTAAADQVEAPESTAPRREPRAEALEMTERPGGDEERDDREPLIKRKSGPYCDFDASEQRLYDLGLPDVSGRMVSIRDFDADLILLDFWGTWCAPCRKSIPHLKELQEVLGDKKLQVVGIACERTPAEERAEKVAEVVKENEINYAVMVTGMDGVCPVQEAFSIQFYPTMILLDREGRILLREEGATDATLARVDREIARYLDRERPTLAADKGDGAARR